MVLGISFFTFSNANVQFVEKEELIWRFYTNAKVLSISKWIKLINEKEFAKTALDKNSKTFVIHVAFLNLALVSISLHLDREAQIISLFTKEIKIPDKYTDFADVFSKKKL